MFKILGTNQKEYGPVSADQIRQWIAQGRANSQTKAQAAGTTDWKPLADFQEFADALQTAAPPAGQPTPTAGPQPPAAPPKANGLAITSLVLGCLGLFSCGITALMGLILGIMALVRINKSHGQLDGKGIALAGTIVSAVFLLIGPLPVAMLLPALSRAKQKAQGIRCMNNIKQLSLGVTMYASDNKNLFPVGTSWCDSLAPYVKDQATFLCPEGKPGLRCHYAFNGKLVGHTMKEIESPAMTVLIFETDGGWNVNGGSELLLAKPRHRNAYVVGFADGHVEMVRANRLEKLRWEP
jgi:prepilin-type processing-associated H-X9-DG protein